jgi:hypothetical protein
VQALSVLALAGIPVLVLLGRSFFAGRDRTSAGLGAAPDPAPAIPRPVEHGPATERPLRQAILFRQLFPPPHDPKGLSYFGGQPTAPPSFGWPDADGDDGRRRPLHFLMQIDCAEVPPAARLGVLPERGVLYFFLDLEWGRHDASRVLYEEGPVGDWVAAPLPVALGPAFGDEGKYVWGWTRELPGGATRCPRTLPKWPFQPVAITIPPAASDESDEDGPSIWWPGDRATENALLEAQGDEVVARSFRQSVLAKDGAIRPPYESYPQDWRAVEICAGLVLDRLRRPYGPVGSRALAAMPAAEREAVLARVGTEAVHWFERAAAEPPFAAVPDADRAAFWAWLEEHAWLARSVLPDAAVASVEASLVESAQAAARIPADAAACVHGRHALALRTEQGVFVTTPDRMLAPPSSVQGNQEEIAATHLLLLELSSNEGLGHHFGEGVYQFWITPEDLRARRFHAVVLTADAY